MDLVELYRYNHKLSQEKRFTYEVIYGKSFFKSEKEIKNNNTILNFMISYNSDKLFKGDKTKHS